MNKHVEKLLQAYYDDELSEHRRKQVEAHLTDCPECIQELEALESLSSLLANSPAPQTHTRPNQFVAQVKLQLPRQEQRTPWQRTRRTIWNQIPVALIVIVLVLQTTAFTNILFAGMEFFGIGGEETNSALTTDLESLGLNLSVDLPSIQIADWVRVVVNGLGIGSYYGIPLLNALVFPAVLGLLYLAWITGWWVGEG